MHCHNFITTVPFYSSEDYQVSNMAKSKVVFLQDSGKLASFTL